jgi:hypothetical protein
VNPLKWQWLGMAVLALGCIWVGFDAQSCSSHKVASAAIAKANKQDAKAVDALDVGVNNAKAAQAQDPAISAGQSNVAQDRARLALDEARARDARAVRPPAAPGAPDPQPVPEPLASPVDADKDRLIADLTDLTQAQAAKIAFLQSAYDSAHTAAVGFQGEAASLRIAVTALQGQPRPWAAGAIYGTSTAGAFVERDLGPFRAGVDVVRRVLPAGNTTVDATARLGWRF